MIDRWVDSYHGKNSNPGTRTFPWQTIQYGVDWLAANKNQTDEATLHILPYQCTENVRMRGAKYSWIRVVGEAAAVPQPDVIPQFCEARPPVVAADRSRPVFEISSAEYVSLKNLNISRGNGGVKATLSPGLRLEDCCLHDNKANGPGGGFSIGRDCEHARVTGCRIWANTSTPPSKGAAGGGGGCITRSKDVRVRDSIFLNNRAVNSNGGALRIEKCEQVEVLSCTIGSRQRKGVPASGGNQAKSGGGIFVIGCQKVSIGKAGDGNVITENSAGLDGGGVAISKSTDTRMQSNTVARNQAKVNGGGVSLREESSLLVTRDQVTDNHCEGDGAGLHTNGAALFLVEVEIDHNGTKKNGGGVFADGGEKSCTLQVTKNSKIHDNVAGWGGGLGSREATVDVRQSVFESNKAALSGGGFNISLGEAILETCQVIDNTAKAAGGGGMVSDNKKLRLSLFNFRGNKARQGGGLYAGFANDCIVTDNLFDSNEATGTAGGMLAGYAERGSIVKNQFRYNRAAEGTGLTCASCKIPPLSVKVNEFRQNAVRITKKGHGGDIFLDICKLGITPADIAADNTVGGQVPDVEHK